MDVEEDFRDDSSLALFVKLTVNEILEKDAPKREKMAELLSHLVERNVLSLSQVKAG